MKNDNYIPPDPYAEDLKKLRAASATPASTFEAEYKATRLRELAAEDGEVATLRAAHEARIAATPQPRLTAAELATYEPPDPWAAGIAALQKENHR